MKARNIKSEARAAGKQVTEQHRKDDEQVKTTLFSKIEEVTAKKEYANLRKQDQEEKLENVRREH